MTKLSISRIKTFKACRRAYELKYIEGLEPVGKADTLAVGADYHALIEGLYNVNCLPPADDNWDKALAMATAYQKYIYPKLKIVEAEKWVEAPELNLIGRVDGIADDGCLVEHKTTSMEVGPEYEYNLQWDEQILAYMLMTGTRKMYYTVCRKPTIRQKKSESDEEFFKRMVEWYDDDTDKKIGIIVVERTDDEVEVFRRDIEAIVNEINHTDNYYKNTLHCFRWGRPCEYAQICLNYDPNQQYIEFERVARDE